MITDRVSSLRLRIRALTEKGKRIAHSQAIHAHAQKLAEGNKEGAALRKCRGALAMRDNTASSTTTVHSAVTVVKALRVRVAQDAAVLADPNAFQPLWQAIAKVNTELRSGLGLQWKAYADARIPPLSTDVLSVLRNIGDLRPQVDRVEGRLRQLRERRELLPTEAAEIEAFDAAVKEAESLWQKLGGDSLPPAVLKFLRDAGTKGAAIDALDEIVLEWLKAHRLWHAFRVTVVRDGVNSGARS